MKHIINIDYFADGISEVDYVCTDIPLAVACGVNNRDKYFYYLLYRSLDANWSRNDGLYKKENIFSRLGMTVKTVVVHNRYEFHDTIKAFIDKKIPLILPVVYCEMPFSERYKDLRFQDMHFVLVNGYFTENGIIYVRLSPHIISGSELNNNIGLYTFRITEKALFKIWKNSQGYNSIHKANLEYQFIVIHDNEVHKKVDITDILDDLLHNYDISSNWMAKEIQNFEKRTDKEFNEFIYYLHIFHEKFMQAFIKIVIEFLEKEQVEEELISKFKNIGEKFLDNRIMVISKFHKQVLRKNDNRQDLLQQVTSLDYEFINQIKIIKKQLDKNKDDGIDYVLKSVISASSEDEDFFSAENIKKDGNEIWRSINDTKPHWICIELSEEILLKKIIMTHDSNYNKVTLDFEIQVSCDGKYWETVSRVKNNTDFMTVHQIRNEKAYKMIRVYITSPGRLTQQARINRIRVYGKKSNDNEVKE